MDPILDGKYGPCPKCGGPNNRSARSGCSACYQQAYRADPEKYALHKERVSAYQKRNYRKWRKWSYIWRERVGIRVPDLQALRKASKRLEQAVADASDRERSRHTSQQHRDRAAE